MIINRENLETLSKGLLGEIEPVIPITAKFDMKQYSNSDYGTVCKTVGCAIGFAPFYGIEKLEDDDFTTYSQKQFISNSSSDLWSWLFGEEWAYVDNTKEGAGLRIKYYLEHGLPDNWEEQMLGDNKLEY